MRLWHVYPEEPFVLIAPRSTRRFHLAFLGMGMLVLHATTGVLPVVSSAFASPIPIQIPRSGKAASPHVGAAMAVLATLEQARVLPPEGTAKANRIIKSVIQLQSLFAKNTDPSVQEFMQRAVAGKHGSRATQVLSQFHSSGWTPDVLEALADGALDSPSEELQRLAPRLRSVNLSVDDFRSFMQLVRDGEQALTEIGKNFHDVFISHRKTMPGAADSH
jgi:hypothetical protein